MGVTVSEIVAAPTIYVIEIPLKIESIANLREHWRVRAARTREHRSIVALALRAQHLSRDYAGALRLDRLTRARVTLTRVAPRALDGDNLSSALKAARDACADVLGLDDRSSRYTWCYAQESSARSSDTPHRRGSAGATALRIEIELT